MNIFGEPNNPDESLAHFYQGDTVYGMRSYMNNPTLYYPGLKGEPLNIIGTDWDIGGEINTNAYQALVDMVGNFLTEVKKEPWAQNDTEIQNAKIMLRTQSELISDDQNVYLDDNPFNLRNAGSNKKFKFKEAVKYE